MHLFLLRHILYCYYVVYIGVHVILDIQIHSKSITITEYLQLYWSPFGHALTMNISAKVRQ